MNQHQINFGSTIEVTEHDRGLIRLLDGENVVHDAGFPEDRLRFIDEKSFTTSLRNGAKPLPLAGSVTHLELKSRDHLLKFFEAAIRACENGELDHLLIQTMPKRKGGV